MTLLKVREVADLLRVTDQTVHNLIRDKKLKAFSVGGGKRINSTDFESFLRQNSNDAESSNEQTEESAN